MEKSAKRGIGAAAIIAGIVALVRYQTPLFTIAGIVLFGIGIWLMFSE